MSTLRRLPPLLLAALAVTAAVVLLDRHPPWPELPASLGLPVTTTFVQRVLLTAAWAALLILLALVAIRAARASRPRTRAVARPAPRTPRATAPPRRPPAAMPLRIARPAEPRSVPTGRLSLQLDVALPAANAAAPDTADAARTAESSPPTVAPDDVQPLRLLLLGPFEIDGAPMPRRSSTRELLAYLALNNGATPDQLLEALWPGADPRRSRPRLWQSTSEARRILGDAFQRDDGGRFHLDHDKLWIDTDELSRQLDLANADEDPVASAKAVEAALALWRGEPLEGTDRPWADSHLRQLRGTQIDLLLRAGTARLESGDARAALHAAERGITLDPLHEPSWRLALQAEGQLGLKDAITARYDRLAEVLDDRLGTRPEPETTSLYRKLLA